MTNRSAPIGRGLYRRAVRPVLFRLPAETAHDLGKYWLRLAPRAALPLPRSVDRDPRLATRLGGLALRNPVGLAAGFDKNGDAVGNLTRLGFGYVITGSILVHPREGNALPRVLRDPESNALANAMGLPSRGVEHASARLRKARLGRRRPVAPVVANIQGFSVDDYLQCLSLVEPWVDAVEITVICPNVYDRDFDALDPGHFERLIRALNAARHRPLFVKLPSPEPDDAIASDSTSLSRTLELAAMARDLGVDALTMAGSFRREAPELSVGRGNVSGPPTRERALRFVRALYEATDGSIDIKALGGMTTGADAYAAIAAGASSVELLTALVYEGPNVARAINSELLQLMKSHGVASLAQLRGSDRST